VDAEQEDMAQQEVTGDEPDIGNSEKKKKKKRKRKKLKKMKKVKKYLPPMIPLLLNSLITSFNLPTYQGYLTRTCLLPLLIST